MDGPPERTASFTAHMDSAAAEAAAVDAKLQEALATVERAAAAHDDDMNRELTGATACDDDMEGFDVAYSGCYLDEDEHEAEWRVEAVLARRVKRGVVHYKVKWRGHNLVTWERDDKVENRVAVDEFERGYAQRAAMPPTARRRFVPPAYASRRVVKNRPARVSTNTGRDSEGRRVIVVWSCEVEPHIWIPYEHTQQELIEQAFRSNQASIAVQVPGASNVSISFARMRQERAGGASRRVQRTEQRDEDDERAHIDSLSLDELRSYIAGLVEFMPVHYEALSRLHQEDKVEVHASAAELSTLVPVTFGALLEQVAEGIEYKGLCDECFICLEDYAPSSSLAMLPQCGHLFHMHCVTDYFQKYSKLCPVCKEPIA